MSIAVLIPAYNPDARLAALVRDLRKTGRFEAIVVVDDGSRAECRPMLDALDALPGVAVLRHAVNLGKGAALKTGMNYVCWALPHCVGIVTADADGQHLAADVVRVAAELRRAPGSLVLGSRRFAGDVPFRSKFGNLATRYAFWGLVGKRLDDTQSGLRGIPLALARQLLRLNDSGYEFELDMLIHCKRAGVPIVACSIATVYLEENRSSHFHPIRDSLRIYAVFLRFIAASLVTAAVDYGVFVLVFRAAGSILAAQAAARAVAAGISFCLARQAVFRSRAGVVRSLAKFLLLVAAMGATSYCLIQAAVLGLGCNVVAAKMVSELLVYLANFAIQRDFIFGDTAARPPAAAPTEAAPSQPAAARRAA